MPKRVFFNLKVPIEVVIFLSFCAYMNDSVQTNLIIYRTCYIIFGYNKSECALLGSQNSDNQTAYLEKKVEPYAALIIMSYTLIENFFSAIVCLFVGPWSDHFGRKPILIFSTIGHLCFYLLLTIFAGMEDASPWYLVFCVLPIALTGGIPTYLTGITCYIADITNNENRGFRMGVFEAVAFLGILFGVLSSTKIFIATNYVVVFLLSAGFLLTNIILLTCFIPESLQKPEIKGRFKKLFKVSYVTDMIKITFQKRQNYARSTVICCILMLILAIIVFNGHTAMTFLFLRKKFQWSLQKFTWFSAEFHIIRILFTVIGIYVLHNILKISESVLMLIAMIFGCFGTMTMGLAQRDWLMFIAPFIISLEGMFAPMIRSFISKVVEEEEIGKIFGLAIASQFLFGVAGSPLYTMFYDNTIDSNPGSFNFMSAGIYFINALIICIMIARSKTKHVTYSRLKEDTETTETEEIY